MVARSIVVLALVASGVAGGIYLYDHQEPLCPACFREMHSVTQYSIHLDSGEVVDACCPRCGLAFQAGRSDVAFVTVADFNSKTALSVEEAFYVEGSRVHMCCSGEPVRKDSEGATYRLVMDRCMPSLVAFATLEEARRFAELKGGEVRDYASLFPETSGSRAAPATH